MTGVLRMDTQRGETHRHKKRKQCDRGGGDYSHAATSQGTCAFPQKLKTLGIRALLKRLECSKSSTLISNFWPLEIEEKKFLFSSNQVCGNLLEQLQVTPKSSYSYFNSESEDNNNLI